MTAFSRPSRRSLLKSLVAVAGGGVTLQAASPESTAVEAGFKILDERYWCDPISIWLDREGDQLRALWEGRVNPPWWSAANAVELLVDHGVATGRMTHDRELARLYEINRDPVQRWPRIAEALRIAGPWTDADEARLKERMAKPSRHTGFRNEFLDDSAWWGVAWLKMYEHTREAKYLETARGIHALMAGNWRPDLGGGVIWCEEPGKQKPNAITNNLFLILSSRLAVSTKQADYRQWADKAYTWLHEKALFDGQGVVDAPGHQGDWWSYNQGTYLGGLVTYATVTGDIRYLDEAALVTEAVLTRDRFVDEKGVIIEKLGTSGWDGCLFKGILARYLEQTRDALQGKQIHPGTVTRIDQVLAATARALLAPGMTIDGQYPADWSLTGKNREHNFNTHLSALMALVAAGPTSWKTPPTSRDAGKD